MRGRVVLVGIGAPTLRNNALSLGQQVVAHIHRLAQQAAGIVTQIDDQPFMSPKLLIASVISAPVVSWNCVRWI